MAKDDIQTNIRLPEALKDRLAAAAEENGRSLTAEMVQRLEQSFEAPGDESTRLLALLAKVQHDLAVAEFQEHLHLVEKSALTREVQDFLDDARREDLFDRLEGLDGFDTLEKVAEGDVYAHSYLEQLAKQREAELVEAKKKMNDALLKSVVEAFMKEEIDKRGAAARTPESTAPVNPVHIVGRLGRLTDDKTILTRALETVVKNATQRDPGAAARQLKRSGMYPAKGKKQ